MHTKYGIYQYKQQNVLGPLLLILCYRSKILNDYAIRRLIIYYRNSSIKIEKLYNSIAIIV